MQSRPANPSNCNLDPLHPIQLNDRLVPGPSHLRICKTRLGCVLDVCLWVTTRRVCFRRFVSGSRVRRPPRRSRRTQAGQSSLHSNIISIPLNTIPNTIPLLASPCGKLSPPCTRTTLLPLFSDTSFRHLGAYQALSIKASLHRRLYPLCSPSPLPSRVASEGHLPQSSLFGELRSARFRKLPMLAIPDLPSTPPLPSPS